MGRLTLIDGELNLVLETKITTTWCLEVQLSDGWMSYSFRQNVILNWARGEQEKWNGREKILRNLVFLSGQNFTIRRNWVVSERYDQFTRERWSKLRWNRWRYQTRVLQQQYDIRTRTRNGETERVSTNWFDDSVRCEWNVCLREANVSLGTNVARWNARNRVGVPNSCFKQWIRKRDFDGLYAYRVNN